MTRPPVSGRDDLSALGYRDPGITDEYEADFFVEFAFQELELGNHASALSNFEFALEARERISGPDHPEIVVILDGLAKLLRQNGREEKAAGLEARAEALRVKIVASAD